MQSDQYSVVSTMKNEAPYILDWVAHYKTLGFDHIIVASNDCTDPTDEILDRLQELGHVFHHNTIPRAGGIQRSAIRQCLSQSYPEIAQSQWVFICDSDEYLNIHIGDHSVRALVEHSGKNIDAVVVPWRVFGPDGEKEIKDISVTKQFTKGELPYDPELRPNAGKFAKSLVTNRKKFKRMGLHIPVVDEDRDNRDINLVLPGGASFYADGEFKHPAPSFEIAQVNHYALRSLNAYLVKRHRGRANHNKHVLGVEYWDRFNVESEPDDSIRRYDEQKQAHLDELLSDSKLKKYHNQALDWHQKKALSISIDPENRELLQSLSERNVASQPTQ